MPLPAIYKKNFFLSINKSITEQLSHGDLKGLKNTFNKFLPHKSNSKSFQLILYILFKPMILA